jgi:hypothetical protein
MALTQVQGGMILPSTTITTPILTTPTVSSGFILNASGRPMAAQTGGILQVLSTTLTSTFTTSTANSWINVTGLSVTITPASTFSKVLVRYVVAGALFRPTLNGVNLRVTRAGTVIGVGDASGTVLQITSSSAIGSNDSEQTACWEFLDSPSTTSSTVYQVQVFQDTPANPFYINRSVSDATQGGRSVSTITVMEVAQ